jgi:hypothetical protein
MNTTMINMNDLVAKAGTNVATPRIVFEQTVFDGTAGFRHDPMASKQAYSDAIDSQFEIVSISQRLEGYTMSDARIALDVVSHMRAEGVPQPVSNDPTVTPKTTRVDTGFDWATGLMQTRTVPAGEMSIPGFASLGKKWQPSMQVIADGHTPVLWANVLRGNQDEANGLFQYVKEYLEGNSIYLGQVVDQFFNFIDLTSFKPENVALTRDQSNSLDMLVRGPLQFQTALDAENMPRKTGYFCYGPPGGGKTMLMTTICYIGARMGAFVVIVDPSTGIDGFKLAAARTEKLLEAGHRGVLAMEDMEMLSVQDRAKVLDILDGSQSKMARRIVVGTTNFIERIDRAMLRPGRFDTVQFCGLPDRQATEHLCRVLLKGRNLEDVDFDIVFEAMQGYSYAFIASAVQNVVRAAINRVKGQLDEEWTVTTEDLVMAADSVRGHFNLMQEEVVVDKTTIDDIFKGHVFDSVEEYLSNNSISTYDDNTNYDYIEEKVRETVDSIVEGRLHNASIVDRDGDHVYNINTN